MRYYITGANGFIGKHMVKYLEAQGHEVIPVKQFVHFNGNWIDREKDFEFIHLSAYGNHYNQKEPRNIIKANITDLYAIVTLLNNKPNCQKFYNISTSAIQLPTDTLYSVSKRFGELMVESLQDDRFVNIRPYSVYGPGEADHRFIPTVIRALHSGETIQLDADACHDWIHVESFIQAMFDGYTEIGSGLSWSNLQIVEQLEKISGKKLNWKPAKLRSYDTKDWVAPSGVHRINIQHGLRETYEWFTQKNLRDKQEA
jgi:nucleoside-diphosphate-sugar epimerase